MGDVASRLGGKAPTDNQFVIPMESGQERETTLPVDVRSLQVKTAQYKYIRAKEDKLRTCAYKAGLSAGSRRWTLPGAGQGAEAA